MTGLVAYFGIVGAVLLGAASPGPSFIVVARTAMGASRRAALGVSIGIGLGGLFFASIALGGLVTLFSLVGPLYTILKVLGACYLLYLAYRIWHSAREPLTLENASAVTSARSAIIRGAVVQLSNPKAAIVYASVFAALLPSSPPLWLYIALPLSIFVVETGWYALVSFGLSHSRIRGLYARVKKWVDRAASAFLAALGLRLLLTASDRGI